MINAVHLILEYHVTYGEGKLIMWVQRLDLMPSDTGFKILSVAVWDRALHTNKKNQFAHFQDRTVLFHTYYKDHSFVN